MSLQATPRLVLAAARSPIGTIRYVTADGVLIALDFEEYDSRRERLMRARFGVFELVQAPPHEPVETALERYFDGDVGAVEALAVDPGGSAFQQQVWRALRTISAGTTTTYGNLARKLGLTPSAARAVGYANSLNPIAIVVPCHRVIGASGELTGYAGGLHRKRWLLDHEGAASLQTRLF